MAQKGVSGDFPGQGAFRNDFTRFPIPFVFWGVVDGGMGRRYGPGHPWSPSDLQRNEKLPHGPTLIVFSFLLNLLACQIG
jgi:hypothetical protein